VERKLFLSTELGIKAIYSSIISYASRQKFGVQDDIVYAIVTRDGGKTHEMISAPHYQPFTRILLQDMAKEQSNNNFSVLDISGNQRITFAYLDQAGNAVPPNTKEITRDTEVRKISDGKKETKDRVTVEAQVKDIFSIYKFFQSKHIAIEHFYDY
jgi:hypothetical protein